MANGMLGFLSRLLSGKLQPACCAMEIEVAPDDRKAEASTATGEPTTVAAGDKAAPAAEQSRA